MRCAFASDKSNIEGPSHHESSRTADFGGLNHCATHPILTLQYCNLCCVQSTQKLTITHLSKVIVTTPRSSQQRCKRHERLSCHKKRLYCHERLHLSWATLLSLETSPVMTDFTVMRDFTAIREFTCHERLYSHERLHLSWQTLQSWETLLP